MFFSFVGERSVCPGTVLVYVHGEWVGESCMMRDAHLLVLPIYTQAGLEPAVVGRNGTNFSQFSESWGGFPRARGSGCHGV
jgi:hypothetical protein